MTRLAVEFCSHNVRGVGEFDLVGELPGGSENAAIFSEKRRRSLGRRQLFVKVFMTKHATTSCWHPGSILGFNSGMAHVAVHPLVLNVQDMIKEWPGGAIVCLPLTDHDTCADENRHKSEDGAGWNDSQKVHVTPTLNP